MMHQCSTLCSYLRNAMLDGTAGPSSDGQWQKTDNNDNSKLFDGFGGVIAENVWTMAYGDGNI